MAICLHISAEKLAPLVPSVNCLPLVLHSGKSPTRSSTVGASAPKPRMESGAKVAGCVTGYSPPTESWMAGSSLEVNSWLKCLADRMLGRCVADTLWTSCCVRVVAIK